MGTEVININSTAGKVSIPHLLCLLAKKGITSILLEGGGTLNSSFINEHLVDKLVLFVAPKIIGGQNAPTCIEGKGIADMNKALLFSFSHLRRFEEDIMLEYYYQHKND